MLTCCLVHAPNQNMGMWLIKGGLWLQGIAKKERQAAKASLRMPSRRHQDQSGCHHRAGYIAGRVIRPIINCRGCHCHWIIIYIILPATCIHVEQYNIYSTTGRLKNPYVYWRWGWVMHAMQLSNKMPLRTLLGHPKIPFLGGKSSRAVKRTVIVSTFLASLCVVTSEVNSPARH